jgi:anti-sigma factor RsiW
MTSRDFPDEILMQFADGELDQETSAKIEQAMETDDELVARVALFIETRAEAEAALRPLLDEPVPDQLVATVERMVQEKRVRTEAAPPANVISLRPAAPGKAAARRWALPLAASIAAVLGGLGGYWLALPGTSGQNSLQVAGINSTALGEALATVASGEQTQLADSSQRFRAIATFRDSAGMLCREFEVDSADRSTVISVACHAQDAWRVSFAVVAPGDNSGYAPASSTEALDAYLSAVDAEAPMEAGPEAQALREISQAR